MPISQLLSLVYQVVLPAHVHTETLVVIDIYYGIQLTNKTNIENDI